MNVCQYNLVLYLCTVISNVILCHLLGRFTLKICLFARVILKSTFNENGRAIGCSLNKAVLNSLVHDELSRSPGNGPLQNGGPETKNQKPKTKSSLGKGTSCKDWSGWLDSNLRPFVPRSLSRDCHLTSLENVVKVLTTAMSPLWSELMFSNVVWPKDNSWNI